MKTQFLVMKRTRTCTLRLKHKKENFFTLVLWTEVVLHKKIDERKIVIEKKYNEKIYLHNLRFAYRSTWCASTKKRMFRCDRKKCKQILFLQS